jgi:hypothetical protein
VDPKVEQRVTKIDKTKWQTISSIIAPKVPVDKEQYVMNMEEFKPVKILRRVYKPSIRRRWRKHEEDDIGIGIGGYTIRFQDGHEYSVHPEHPVIWLI